MVLTLMYRCGLFFNSTIGFCLPMLPKPAPALVCERAPPTCASLLLPTDCAGSSMCKWIPTGPPSSPKGLCIYDWDKCKAPVANAPAAALTLKRSRAPAAAVEVAAGAAAAVVPPPATKLACNNTSPADCDARPCCQWCSSAGGAAAVAGFCMPVLQWPAPALMCSKGTGACTGADASACAASGAECSWHPFGPPGAAGPGICAFDWDKCAAAE
jgi:hypothetical protein